MKIRVFDDLLPNDFTEAMSTVLQRHFSGVVSVYGDVPWNIATSVAMPQLSETFINVKTLKIS